MFTWAELQQLNAGDWFLSRDPFGTVSSLSEMDHYQAQNQSIPSLAQFLEVAAHSGRLVLFDLRRPPHGHPYSQSYINTTLQVVQAHIKSSQVLWLPSEDRELVQAVDPELQQTFGGKASIQELTDAHITRLNLHYSTMSQPQISKYQSVNISTNLYVISQPWLYTLAWCAGAQSVTTNSIHILSKINEPLFLMTPEEYNLMWILTDAVSAVLIIAVFIFHWWRERGLPFWSGSRQTHENGPYSKFRTDSAEVLCVRWVPLHSDPCARSLCQRPAGLEKRSQFTRYSSPAHHHRRVREGEKVGESREAVADNESSEGPVGKMPAGTELLNQTSFTDVMCHQGRSRGTLDTNLETHFLSSWKNTSQGTGSTVDRPPKTMNHNFTSLSKFKQSRGRRGTCL
ncbi:hypothetical protein Q5P01_009563 [Channa striata]|uniref:GP-PDE domain-containing protein n=1 Tax=Channa striata TaxID=64152 RepID=A0AA88SQW8_CHASR|nr:hypothetical protein Q5P01_009563 [Channa striata]